MAWIVAPNMARAKSDSHTVWPGMTIYSIGDEAHQLQASGHNPDDTAGMRAELSDPDGKQEVRALDWMIGSVFTWTQAERLANALVNTPSARSRLYYVIWNRKYASRNTGWRWVDYGGSDPHTNHVHGSGWWEDDDNTAPWASILALGGVMGVAEEVWNYDLVGAEAPAAGIALQKIFLRTPWNLATGVANSEATKINTEALLERMDQLIELSKAILAKERGDVEAIVAGVLAGLPAGSNAEAIAEAVLNKMAERLVE